MKTWQKITIILLILALIGILVFLYFYGASTTNPDDPDGVQNPVFPFEPPVGDDGDDFFSGDSGDPSDDDEENDPEEKDRLWRVSDRPVAGSGWVTREDGSQAIWYVLKENGHVYEHDIENRASTRLTNTTIPRVQEAIISPNGEHVIYRYIDIESRNIKTFLATTERTPDGETLYSIDGSFLPDNLTEVNLSPDGNRIFSFQNTTDGVIGVLYNITTDEGEVFFDSPLQEWRSEWNHSDLITIFTKPAAGVTGVAYQLNTTSGEKTKIIDGSALTASLHPSNQYLLTGKQESGSYRSRLYEMDDLTSNVMSPATLVEKCNWSDDELFCGIPNNLPNKPLKDWYQGKINFSDQLVSFHLATRNQDRIFTEEELNKGPFDIIKISPANNTEHLIFTNHRNNDLWAIDLENDQEN
ncbi:MAG: hypothetical protein WD335_00335 [Candidatus Paceibacterota bacterium]